MSDAASPKVAASLAAVDRALADLEDLLSAAVPSVNPLDVLMDRLEGWATVHRPEIRRHVGLSALARLDRAPKSVEAPYSGSPDYKARVAMGYRTALRQALLAIKADVEKYGETYLADQDSPQQAPEPPAATDIDERLAKVSELLEGMRRYGELRATRGPGAEELRSQLAVLWGEVRDDVVALRVPMMWQAYGQVYPAFETAISHWNPRFPKPQFESIKFAISSLETCVGKLRRAALARNSPLPEEPAKATPLSASGEMQEATVKSRLSHRTSKALAIAGRVVAVATPLGSFILALIWAANPDRGRIEPILCVLGFVGGEGFAGWLLRIAHRANPELEGAFDDVVLRWLARAIDVAQKPLPAWAMVLLIVGLTFWFSGPKPPTSKAILAAPTATPRPSPTESPTPAPRPTPIIRPTPAQQSTLTAR